MVETEYKIQPSVSKVKTFGTTQLKDEGKLINTCPGQ